MSKFYYDVCIEYDEEKKEGEPYSSKVEKSWYLDQPLLEQPGDYNLCVSKFSINTEALPVFIPEYKQPQNRAKYINNELETNYEMNIIFYYEENGNKKLTGYSNNLFLNYAHDKKRIEKIHEIRFDYYINNLDRNYFCYDYTEFILAINMLFMNSTKRLKEKAKDNNGVLLLDKVNFRDIYFSLEGDKLILNIPREYYDNKYGNVTMKGVRIDFSENMYRLIGNGFPCYKYEGSFWTYKTNIEDLWSNDDYYYLEQSFSTLVNWNPLKAIIIGTDTLPVVDEYIPVAHYDGHLTHYKTREYLDFLKDLGKEFNDSTQDVFKRNSMKILDVYYPLTTAPGDIRSTCILSREDIDQGQTIELLPGSPVRRFNIWVKWLDIYGNLHDLYQYPGCCCDIRLCFTKKPVIKADIATATETIVSSLAPPDPKKNKKEPFLKQMMSTMNKSNGKPDGIDLPGADNYGWVHL